MNDQPVPTQQPAPTSLEHRPPTQDEKNMGMFCHLAALAGVIVPFGNIIGPLVIWLLKKDQSDYIDHHGKEALNFQITIAIGFVISFVLVFVVIGVLLIVGLAIFDLVVIIMATIKASEGVRYTYPFSLKLIK